MIAALTLGACTSPEPDLDELAREYLFLELSMGQHDEAHVDAYFGPEELRTAAEETALTLDQILTASQDLAARLAAIDAQDTMLVMRIDALLARLRALDTRIAINKGEYLDFDDESLALFGSRAPQYDAAHFQDILDRIDALLPGEPLISLTSKPRNFQPALPSFSSAFSLAFQFFVYDILKSGGRDIAIGKQFGIIDQVEDTIERSCILGFSRCC